MMHNSEESSAYTAFADEKAMHNQQLLNSGIENSSYVDDEKQHLKKPKSLLIKCTVFTMLK